MTFKLNFLPAHGLNQVLKSVWEISSWCWPGSVTEGGLSACKGCLRRFLLLKLMTALLFPRSAGVPLLMGCALSLRVLMLLRSPHISTKPSTVLLCRLALTDALALLHWVFWLGATLARWMEGCGFQVNIDLIREMESCWWREAVDLLSQQLLDAHHLASLLLLGLLGLEAMLVSRWPQQTRRFRTSRWAQLSCSLIWTLVLLELFFSLHLKLFQDSRPQAFPSILQNSQTSSLDLMPHQLLPTFSSRLRKILRVVNLWLHYTVLYNTPQRRSFH